MTDLFGGESPIVLKFVVPGEPVGKGRPQSTVRSGFVKEYTPAKTRNYENLIKLAFSHAYPDFKPYEKSVPLVLRMDAYYSIPASWSQKKQKLAVNGYIRPTKKPDTDNVSKCKDALNEIAWHDDAQIVDDHVSKWYSEKPRLEITIEVWKP